MKTTIFALSVAGFLGFATASPIIPAITCNTGAASPVGSDVLALAAQLHAYSTTDLCVTSGEASPAVIATYGSAKISMTGTLQDEYCTFIGDIVSDIYNQCGPDLPEGYAGGSGFDYEFVLSHS